MTAGSDGRRDEGHVYVGPDRRSVATTPASVPRRFFAVATATAVALSSAPTLLAVSDRTPWTTVDVGSLSTLVATATVAMTLVLAGASLVRWRLVGDTASLRLAFGIAMLAVTVDGARAGGAALHASALVVSGALLWWAVHAPAVDTRVRASTLVGRVAVSFAAAAGGVALAGTPALMETGLHGASAVVWGALAIASIRAGFRACRPALAWFGLALAALALSALYRVAGGQDASVTALVPSFVELAAVTLAVWGAGVELATTWAQQQRRLLHVETEYRIADVHRRVTQAWARERAHDARSALLAIQGAAVDLERWGLDLHDDPHAALARALADEAARLQRLVDDQEPRLPRAGSAFDVREALNPVVTCHRSTDLGLTFDVPAGVRAAGSADKTAEVVANLLDNATRHAPGSPVTVRGDVEMGNVVLRVEDRGPGIDPPEREMIFERGRRGLRASGPGSGLGLYTARSMMREQGGDLWVEGRPGGGASFVLFLPLAAPAPDAAEAADAVELRGDDGAAEQVP